MRFFTLLSGAAWLTLLGSAAAQTTGYTAFVNRDDTEVRAGPNDDPRLYITNRLQRGTPVQVVEEVGNGWLKIQPTAGSFSWINTRYLRQIVPNQPNWVIDGHPDVRAPVIVGTDFTKDVASQIESARLARGAQVTSIGPARVDDQGTWLPVVPPPGEFRYIRSDFVTKSDGTMPGRPPIPALPFSTTSSTKPLSGVAATTDAEGLWLQAQQAERAGNLPVAIDLYARTSVLCQTSSPELSLQASNRAHWLRESLSHSTFTPSTSDFRGTPASNVQLSGPITGQTLPPGTLSIGPGRLRRAGRSYEGLRTYVLESLQGVPLAYATGEPGVEMEPFLNQSVQMIGTMGYNGQLRANLMRVSRMQVVP